MKRCLIVDGCSTGKHLVKYLKERGYQCIHLQSHSNPYVIEHGGAAFDEYETTLVHDGDFEKTLETVVQLNPEFIIPGSEPGVELANDLSYKLGLCSNAAHTGLACRNKYVMHESLKRAGIKSIDHFLVSDAASGLNWALQHRKWPIVAKPLDSGGGDGFHICENPAELIKSILSILNSQTIFEKKNEKVLLEEYIDGPEYVVNTVSCEGHHYIESIMKHKKIRVDDGQLIYDRTSLVSREDIPNVDVLMRYSLQVLDALGIRFGATHCEIKFPEEGPILIECAARLMGAALIPSILSSCLGHNQIELTVLAYTNPQEFYQYTSKPYFVIKYLSIFYLISSKSGYLESTQNLDLIRQLPSFSHIRLFVKEGERIHKTIDLPTAAGDVFLAHEKKEMVEQDCQKIRDLESKGLLKISPAIPSVVS